MYHKYSCTSSFLIFFFWPVCNMCLLSTCYVLNPRNTKAHGMVLVRESGARKGVDKISQDECSLKFLGFIYFSGHSLHFRPMPTLSLPLSVRLASLTSLLLSVPVPGRTTLTEPRWNQLSDVEILSSWLVPNQMSQLLAEQQAIMDSKELVLKGHHSSTSKGSATSCMGGSSDTAFPSIPVLCPTHASFAQKYKFFLNCQFCRIWSSCFLVHSLEPSGNAYFSCSILSSWLWVISHPEVSLTLVLPPIPHCCPVPNWERYPLLPRSFVLPKQDQTDYEQPIPKSHSQAGQSASTWPLVLGYKAVLA